MKGKQALEWNPHRKGGGKKWHKEREREAGCIVMAGGKKIKK